MNIISSKSMLDLSKDPRYWMEDVVYSIQQSLETFDESHPHKLSLTPTTFGVDLSTVCKKIELLRVNLIQAGRTEDIVDILVLELRDLEEWEYLSWKAKQMNLAWGLENGKDTMI